MDNNKQISRATYKTIKGMDRAGLSAYLTKIYLTGFEAGRKAGTPDVLFRTIREQLLDIEGIGPVRADAIMEKLTGSLAPKKSEEEPREAAGVPAENKGNSEEVSGNDKETDGSAE